MTPRWELFADILKVGVPGLINIAITNLSVVMLTGIAGQLGRDTALGYAMGARLEYILQPIAFGFGTAIVAMVGTNWGARQYRRAREIAWTGAAIVALLCGTIGLIVAFEPGLWIGLFSDDADVARLGALYLHIVGPAYLCFGLGLGLFYVTQGVGRGVAAMNANAVRMMTSAGGGARRGLLVRSRRRRLLCRRGRRLLRLRRAPRLCRVQRQSTRIGVRDERLAGRVTPHPPAAAQRGRLVDRLRSPFGEVGARGCPFLRRDGIRRGSPYPSPLVGEGWGEG